MTDIVKYSIRNTFNMNVPEKVSTLGYAASSDPAILDKDDNYIFRKEIVRDITAFLKKPFGDALYITGPTGTGKTSAVVEISARLFWPVQQVTAHGRMELPDLIGHHALISPKPGDTPVMKFMYGPLAIAMKKGHIFLLNEIDLADPAELAGMNDVLEGRPLCISQNGGEIIKPHPMFRVIVTGNSAGSGDSTGLYQGIMMQNLAAMDRYRFIKIGYADEDIEMDILARATPTLNEGIRQSMVKVANEVRKLFMGENGDDGKIAVTMSTRTLVRWAKLTLQFRGAPNTIEYALNQSLLVRAAKEEQEAIIRIAKDVFGDQWR